MPETPKPAITNLDRNRANRAKRKLADPEKVRESKRIRRAKSRARQRSENLNLEHYHHKPAKGSLKHTKAKVLLLNYDISFQRGSLGAYVGVKKEAEKVLRTLNRLMRQGLKVVKWDGK